MFALAAALMMAEPDVLIRGPGSTELKTTPPPESAWQKDFTIEVSEAEGLPRASQADVLKACVGFLECRHVSWTCSSPTVCESVNIDPYWGTARRVRIRAATVTAMSRAEPVARAIAGSDRGGGSTLGTSPLGGEDYSIVRRTVTPDWLQTPSAAILESNYPLRARDLGRSGAGVVECQLTQEGALAKCDPVGAYPSGMAFDKAALRVASQLHARSDTQAWRGAVGKKVLVRIDFLAPAPGLVIPRDPVQ